MRVKDIHTTERCGFELRAPYSIQRKQIHKTESKRYLGAAHRHITYVSLSGTCLEDYSFSIDLVPNSLFLRNARSSSLFPQRKLVSIRSIIEYSNLD
jgi:hypothetical protein